MNPVTSRFDLVLLVLIVGFVWGKASFLARSGNLGRSMAAFNVAIGCAYLFSVVMALANPPPEAWLPGFPPASPAAGVLLVIRLAVLATACWGAWELTRLKPWTWRRRRVRSPNGKDVR